MLSTTIDILAVHYVQSFLSLHCSALLHISDTLMYMVHSEYIHHSILQHFPSTTKLVLCDKSLNTLSRRLIRCQKTFFLRRKYYFPPGKTLFEADANSAAVAGEKPDLVLWMIGCLRVCTLTVFRAVCAEQRPFINRCHAVISNTVFQTSLQFNKYTLGRGGSWLVSSYI